MKKIILFSLGLISTTSFAFTDNASIVSFDKVMKTKFYQTPYEVCRSEEVPVYSQKTNDSYTDEIFGGIIGGVIGNQLGSGRGNKAMTAAGTLLGASIASDNSRSDDTRVVGYRQIDRCTTQYKKEYKEVFDYYLVTAKYNNREFTYRSDTLPGASVKVTITPNP